VNRRDFISGLAVAVAATQIPVSLDNLIDTNMYMTEYISLKDREYDLDLLKQYKKIILNIAKYNKKRLESGDHKIKCAPNTKFVCGPIEVVHSEGEEIIYYQFKVYEKVEV